MRRSLSFALVLIATLALSACSGGGDSDSDPGGDATTASRAPSADAVAVVSAEPPTPEEAFAEVLSRLGQSQYRITYAFTTTVGGQAFTGELTWVRATDGRQRFETVSEEAGQAFTLILIQDAAGERVTCFEVSGFASCFEGEEGPAGAIPNPTEIIFDNVLNPDRIAGVRETGTRMIAGLEATCYEVDAGSGDSETCIGAGNFLLSASWTVPNGDGGGFEAIEFSTDVSDEDFEPTGPIVG